MSSNLVQYKNNTCSKKNEVVYTDDCIDNELKQTFNHLNKIENINMADAYQIIDFCSEKGLRNIELKGRNLYKKHPELRDVSIVMEHPEFRKFYDKYMQDWKKFKRMMVLMKLYEFISNRVNSDTKRQYFNSYHVLVILYNILKSPQYSHILFQKNNTLTLDPHTS